MKINICNYENMVRKCVLTYNNNQIDDDLMQEGYMAIIEAEKKYKPENNIQFSTFAWTCIRNKILNIQSKRKYRQHEVLTCVINKQHDKTLIELINLLSDIHRYIILNRYGFDDCKKMTEIAKDLSLHPKTLSNKLREALSILKYQLTKLMP